MRNFMSVVYGIMGGLLNFQVFTILIICLFTSFDQNVILRSLAIR
jgi:hypothetical protein